MRFALALAALAVSAFVCAPLRVHAVDAAGIFERGGPRLIVTRRVHTGPQPKSVTVSPDGRQLWVAVFGRRNHDNVEVYGATSLSLWGRVSFEGNAVESVFTRDGRTAYVSNFSRGTVEEIDVGTRTVRASIPGGLNPKVLVLSADDRLLYVVNWRSNDVYVVDTHTRARLQTLPTGRHPRGLVVLANGNVLVASTETDVIHEFTRDGTERRRIAACDFPRALSLSQDERTLYVTCSGLSLVVAYDLASGTRIFAARTGANPRSLAASRDGRFLATADFDGTSVTLVDLVGRVSRRGPIDDASQIVGVAVSPQNGLRIYATGWRSRELLMLEPER